MGGLCSLFLILQVLKDRQRQGVHCGLDWFAEQYIARWRASMDLWM